MHFFVLAISTVYTVPYQYFDKRSAFSLLFFAPRFNRTKNCSGLHGPLVSWFVSLTLSKTYLSIVRTACRCHIPCKYIWADHRTFAYLSVLIVFRLEFFSLHYVFLINVLKSNKTAPFRVTNNNTILQQYASFKYYPGFIC